MLHRVQQAPPVLKAEPTYAIVETAVVPGRRYRVNRHADAPLPLCCFESFALRAIPLSRTSLSRREVSFDAAPVLLPMLQASEHGTKAGNMLLLIYIG
jgi:hypothetical protein